ncbi:MAG: HAMP domain-containing protein [Nitrosospira sp.]|nr:HAMP domain-containing protein [Nitrosospira sp.]
MRISLFTNFFLIIIVLGLGLLIFLSSQALGTLDHITKAERQKYRSLQLANELFQSSEDLTKTARSYVATGDPIYERFFFEILDIRNGKRPRPPNYSINYWKNVRRPPVQSALVDPVSLMELMRREGFSERELELLQQAQEVSDNLVNLEKQAFAAMKGLYDNGHGNFTVPRAPDRDFAIKLLFDEHYTDEKARIMVPISRFMLELDHRTQTRLSNLQSEFQQQMLLILALLCTALLLVAVATFYVRRNILRPLEYLRRQASSIAQGSYSTRCDISSHNEIAELGAGFNTMAEAIEHEITKLKQVEGSLRERLKEIRCFYAIRRGMEAGSLEEVCRTIFVQLTAAMQFPDITIIRIELDGKQFVSHQDDRDHTHGLRKQIVVYGRAYGWIAVFYREDQPFLLPEEQNLIDVIGNDLGKWLEHKQAEERILVEQELRVRDAAMREFAAHLERMREEDRKYIARELHDELGQLLAALQLEISLLKGGEGNGKGRVEAIRRNLSELVDKADQSMRDVAEHLRPASLELGIISALKKLTDEFRKHSGVTCVLQLKEAPIDLDEDQTVTIFRIVQESLTNIARHAEASRVDINLLQRAGNLIVEVRDNGKGFDFTSAVTKKSFGLLGMRERAAALGGSIDINSRPQQGTVVCVRMPLKRNKEI